MAFAPRQAAPADPASPTAIDAVVNEIFANPSRVPASFLEDLRFQAEHADRGQLDALTAESRNLASAPYASLRMPVLVIWGEADAMIPAEFAAALAPFLDALAQSPTAPMSGPDRET